MRTSGSAAPQPYGTVHAAFAELIKKLGGFEKAATRCSRQKSRLQAYASQNQPLETAPLHIVLELEAHCDEKPVTSFMAKQANMVVVALPDVTADFKWLEHIAHISKEFADVVSEATKALENDGDIDPAEAARLLKEIDENMDALGRLRAAVEARRADISNQSVA